MKKYYKQMFIAIMFLIYMGLFKFIEPISEYLIFFKIDYTNIIGYFIYFLFLYMFILFSLKQFDLYKLLFFKDETDNDDNKNSIIKTDNDDNRIWKNIILNIELTHHNSILSKIKKLDIENIITFPKFNKNHDFNIVFLHKIREFIILFENILEKLNHRELDKDKENKDFIQKKLYELYIYKYKFKMKLIFIKLIYYSIPYLFLFLSLKYFLPIEAEKEAFIAFTCGLAILLFSMPVLLLLNNLYHFIKVYIFKKMNIVFSKSLLLDITSQIFIALFITIIILSGFEQLNKPAQLHKFHDIFFFFKDIVFSTEIIVDENLSKTYSFIINTQTNIANYILISKLIISILGMVIILDIINAFIKEYDQFFYEQKIKRYLLPPELLKVLGLLLASITFITYSYVMVSSYPYIKKDTPKTNVTTDKNVTQFIAMDNIAKAIEEKTSLEDILPFGLFLALFGTLLSISSRDITANYFAGLSMKMNHPYEEGDRVTIDKSSILEVIEIGIRNDKFYNISSNAILTLPHTKLATSSIENYTHPTLDYRQHLTINVKNESLNSPREAEKILLVTAFINTGVKLPKIDKAIREKCKDIDLNLFESYKDKNHSELDEVLNSESNEMVQKINDIWKKLSEINESELENGKSYFFKNLFIDKFPIDDSADSVNNNTIISIKKALIAIIASVIEYQDKIENDFPSKSDAHGIRRKHMIFNDKDKNLKIKEFANILVDISFYYYMLANRLWELKNKQTTLTQKRKIDKAMTQILNVPRVTSSQEFNDGINFWKVKLLVTLELSEQCDETIHHMNMYIDKIWDIFLGKDKTPQETKG